MFKFYADTGFNLNSPPMRNWNNQLDYAEKIIVESHKKGLSMRRGFILADNLDMILNRNQDSDILYLGEGKNNVKYLREILLLFPLNS
jgi:hypothetical protein